MVGFGKRDEERGMTLVELLVALAIMSVMVTIGLGMTHAAQRSLLAAEKRQEALDLVAIRQFVKSQIESAAPVVDSVERGRPVLDFHGAAHSLDFVSAGPVQAEQPVLQRTRIYIDNDNIVLERFPVSDPDAVERRILAAGVAELRFTYFEPRRGQASKESTDWSGRAEFPALVRIEADMRPETPAWRPLSARPNISARW